MTTETASAEPGRDFIRGIIAADIAAPAIDRGLDEMRQLARNEIGLPAAGAEPDDADLAAGMRL